MPPRSSACPPDGSFGRQSSPRPQFERALPCCARCLAGMSLPMELARDARRLAKKKPGDDEIAAGLGVFQGDDKTPE